MNWGNIQKIMNNVFRMHFRKRKGKFILKRFGVKNWGNLGSFGAFLRKFSRNID